MRRAAEIEPALFLVLKNQDGLGIALQWAAKNGIAAMPVSSLDDALERAAECATPVVVLFDHALRGGLLAEAETLILLSEQTVGLLRAVEPGAVWSKPGDGALIERIALPFALDELEFRVGAALERAAHARASVGRPSGREPGGLWQAAKLLEPSPEPLRGTLQTLLGFAAGASAAAARWHGDQDRDSISQLALIGSGEPDWIAIRQLLASGEARVEPRLAESSPLLAMIRGTAVSGLIAMPIGHLADGQLGALVLWSKMPLSKHPDLDVLCEIAASRLGFELGHALLRERAQRLLQFDPLTRLANRSAFTERLGEILRDARRSNERLAALVVNLDRFKGLNEELGHDHADRVLVEVGRRLCEALRGDDLVGRYGGDEFVVLLRDLKSRAGADTVASKLRAVLRAPMAMCGQAPLEVSATIGICHFPDDARSADELLRQADIAMRAGKALGRNQTHTFVADLRDARRERAALESKLRDAQTRGELLVHFQPQVDAAGADIVGVEALLRWQHPELGTVSPAHFIPIAEESGLIVPIGRWVLLAAAQQVRRWQQRFAWPLRLAVNLSAVQLRNADVLADVSDALAASGLAPDTLELEVTESVSVKEIPHLLETLEGLRALGCQIAIDDFGTGQSSLDYIRRFPADRIKIDQVFVRNIGVDPDDEAIVKATIQMAHSMGRGVVAEGVELESHFEFLRAHQCDELQGYLFCRPLPAAALENLLVERERLLAARR